MIASFQGDCMTHIGLHLFTALRIGVSCSHIVQVVCKGLVRALSSIHVPAPAPGCISQRDWRGRSVGIFQCCLCSLCRQNDCCLLDTAIKLTEITWT